MNKITLGTWLIMVYEAPGFKRSYLSSDGQVLKLLADVASTICCGRMFQYGTILWLKNSSGVKSGSSVKFLFDFPFFV